MAKIHDKYVIELKEVIKGYGNDPTVKDPLRFPCDYKFYEIDGVAICENSFKKMKRLEDVAIPKDQYEKQIKTNNRLVNDNAQLRASITMMRLDYENRLKADMVAMLEELRTQMEKYEPKWVENDEQSVASCRTWEDLDGIIQQKINELKGKEDGNE